MRTRLHIAVATLSLAAFACNPQDPIVPMPPELIGTWTTNNAPYADRFFTLTPREITLGTGAGTSERYRIKLLRRSQRPDGLLYTVEYVDQHNTTYSMRFYFDATGAGSIRLKNQPRMVWRKSIP